MKPAPAWPTPNLRQHRRNRRALCQPGWPRVSATVMHIEMRVAWWLFPYLNTVGALCCLFGVEPNMDRFNYWVHKGLAFKLVAI